MATMFSKVEYALAAMILVTITLLVFAAGAMRWFGYPLIWSVDLAQALFPWLCFLGANRALRQRTHLGVDMFARQLPVRMRLYLEIAFSVVITAFLGLLAFKGVELTMLNLERLMGDSGLSYAYVTISVPFGAVIMSLTILGNALEAIRTSGQTLIFTNGDVDPEEQLP